MSIPEILEAHYDAAWNYQGRRECACGHEFTAGYSAPIHRAHVAQVLEQHERERCYEAWREGVAVLDPDAVDIMEAANPYRDRP